MREQTQNEMMAEDEVARAAKRRAEDERRERRRKEAEAKKRCQGKNGHTWSPWSVPERLDRGWEGIPQIWRSRLCGHCGHREGYSSPQSQERKSST